MQLIWVVNTALMFATFCMLLYLTYKSSQLKEKTYPYLSSLLTLLAFWMTLFHLSSFINLWQLIETSETLIALLLIITGLYYGKLEGFL